MESFKQPASLDWRTLLGQSLTSVAELSRVLKTDLTGISAVAKTYPVRINPYYLSLIKEQNDPIWRQAIPSEEELLDQKNPEDPLHEKRQSPIRNIIHRYPDRVIFFVSNRCAMYCRHCMRKRQVGIQTKEPSAGFRKKIDEGIDYIKKNSKIFDVILSGGDPLLLSNEQLHEILTRLFAIPHLGVVRIHTRIPCTLPHRITPDLVTILKKFTPLYINAQFNHPDELTPEAQNACAQIAEAGIPMGCQSVLLKGINDSFPTLRALFEKLVQNRIRPYYLHHPDPVKGTAHFRPDIHTGLSIMEQLRGTVSGLCVPNYMIDLPGGGGKIPLLPDYIEKREGNKITIRNYKGKIFNYF